MSDFTFMMLFILVVGLGGGLTILWVGLAIQFERRLDDHRIYWIRDHDTRITYEGVCYGKELKLSADLTIKNGKCTLLLWCDDALALAKEWDDKDILDEKNKEHASYLVRCATSKLLKKVGAS